MVDFVGVMSPDPMRPADRIMAWRSKKAAHYIRILNSDVGGGITAREPYAFRSVHPVSDEESIPECAAPEKS